jgi:hypothetical protein
MMPDRMEKLRAAVEELERELHSLDQVDPETRLLLEEAHREIQGALAARQPENVEARLRAAPPGSLAGRLEEAAQRFEATHPTLAGVLERLVNGLAQLGI